MPQREILPASWNHTNRIWGLRVFKALTGRPDPGRQAWQRTRWTASWSVDVSILLFLKMETHPGTKIHTGLLNLASSPTYLHTSDSRGENNPRAIRLLQGLPASLYIFFHS